VKCKNCGEKATFGWADGGMATYYCNRHVAALLTKYVGGTWFSSLREKV
jgi:hypothetical protein